MNSPPPVSSPAAQASPASPAASAPNAPNVMLLAEIGNGKTHALQTLVDAGIEVFVLATEPGWQSVLGHTDPRRLHVKYLPPSPFSWDMLEQQINSVNTKDLQGLCTEKVSRNQFRQMLDFVNVCKNFRCDRTGESYGDIRSWGPERAFCIDTFSGLTEMAINAWAGTRIGLDKPDYQVVQKVLQNTITSLCATTKCWFVLTGHLEREMQESTQQVQLTISTFGRKLAPTMGRTFDEVLMCKRKDGRYLWSNDEPNALLKKRLLPLSSTLEPSFKQLVHNWRTATQPRM